MPTNNGVRKGRVLLLAFALSVSWCAAQSLTWLGVLNYRNSGATDVSADGSIVVGFAFNQNFDYRTFRWQNGAMEPIAPRNGFWSQAFGVSADGNVVVGDAMNDLGQMVAFRWTAREGTQFLGALGGTLGRAEAATAEYPNNIAHAFRWTEQSGLQDIDTLNSPWSIARDVSDDGDIIVGQY